MFCIEYVRLHHRYEAALLHWGQVRMSSLDPGLAGASARQAEQLRGQAQNERDAASARMAVHRLACPDCGP